MNSEALVLIKLIKKACILHAYTMKKNVVVRGCEGGGGGAAVRSATCSCYSFLKTLDHL